MSLILNLYFFLSVGIIISSSFVVFSTNPVYSLLWLVLSFLFSSSFLLSLGCEFLALIFIVVYVGAIAVLFLFVVMLLDLKIKNLREKKSNAFTFFIIFGIFFLLFLLILNFNFTKCSQTTFSQQLINKTIYAFNNLVFSVQYFFHIVDKIDFVFINWQEFVYSKHDIQIYSFILYDVFVVQFLLVGFVLLAVLLGVVYLTNSYRSSKIIDQATFKQISINSNFFYK